MPRGICNQKQKRDSWSYQEASNDRFRIMIPPVLKGIRNDAFVHRCISMYIFSHRLQGYEKGYSRNAEKQRLKITKAPLVVKIHIWFVPSFLTESNTRGESWDDRLLSGDSVTNHSNWYKRSKRRPWKWGRQIFCTTIYFSLIWNSSFFYLFIYFSLNRATISWKTNWNKTENSRVALLFVNGKPSWFNIAFIQINALSQSRQSFSSRNMNVIRHACVAPKCPRVW